MSHPLVTLVGMGAHLQLARTPDPRPAERFARVALTGLAGLGTEGDLALRLGLSAWMRLAGVGPGQAGAVLAGLREPVLTGSGLDRRDEPVPFRVPDPEGDLLLLAGYLAQLLIRAARTTGTDRATVALQALEA